MDYGIVLFGFVLMVVWVEKDSDSHPVITSCSVFCTVHVWKSLYICWEKDFALPYTNLTKSLMNVYVNEEQILCITVCDCIAVLLIEHDVKSNALLMQRLIHLIWLFPFPVIQFFVPIIAKDFREKTFKWSVVCSHNQQSSSLRSESQNVIVFSKLGWEHFSEVLSTGLTQWRFIFHLQQFGSIRQPHSSTTIQALRRARKICFHFTSFFWFTFFVCQQTHVTVFNNKEFNLFLAQWQTKESRSQKIALSLDRKDCLAAFSWMESLQSLYFFSSLEQNVKGKRFSSLELMHTTMLLHSWILLFRSGSIVPKFIVSTVTT